MLSVAIADYFVAVTARVDGGEVFRGNSTVDEAGFCTARFDLPADISEAEARAAALNNENVTRFLEGKTVRKFIVVPGKLINIVVGG